MADNERQTYEYRCYVPANPNLSHEKIVAPSSFLARKEYAARYGAADYIDVVAIRSDFDTQKGK